ncbi:MAG: TonB family protein [bacterium]|nr:TonB family protein [bacterium]
MKRIVSFLPRAFFARNLVGVFASLLLHLTAAVVLVWGVPASGHFKKDATIKMAIREIEKAEPTTPPSEKILPPEFKPSPPRPHRENPPQKDAEPPKPVFGVTMDSVAAGGGDAQTAMSVGNNLMMAPGREFVDPRDVRPYFVPSYRITEMPKPIRIVKVKYPEQARQAGIEGRVQLKLYLNQEGMVIKVEVVKGIDPELDEASRGAAISFLFTPAKVDGVAVPAAVPFAYNWKITN